MKCKNCGKRLRSKEMFCSSCGFYNGNSNNVSWESEGNLLEEEQQEVKEENYEEIKEVNEVKEVKEEKTSPKEDFYYENEPLLESFIGEDYKSISKNIFNVWAFLLSWIYFIYRKLYIIGGIGLLLTLIIIVLLRNSLFFIYLGIAMIACGFAFNPIYIMIAKKKIEKLKEENQDTDNYTLSNMAMEKGGVNLLVALGSYLVFLIILFFILVPLRYNKDHNTNFWQENSENQATCISLIKTAYNNSDQEYDLGDITEAACKVIKTTGKEYEIYLKTVKDRQYIYSLYKTENNYLKYENNTELYNELLKKKTNGTITQEERELYDKISNIESDYQDIYNQSSKEAKLIKEKRNKSERTSFVFSKEEIIR